MRVARGFLNILCRRSVGFFSWAVLIFLVKESKKGRREQPGKLMAKSRSQPVNLPGARPLMNPLSCSVTWANCKPKSTSSPEYNQYRVNQGCFFSKFCPEKKIDCRNKKIKYMSWIKIVSAVNWVKVFHNRLTMSAAWNGQPSHPFVAQMLSCNFFTVDLGLWLTPVRLKLPQWPAY